MITVLDGNGLHEWEILFFVCCTFLDALSFVELDKEASDNKEDLAVGESRDESDEGDTEVGLSVDIESNGSRICCQSLSPNLDCYIVIGP